MTEPDPDNDPQKLVKPATPLSDDPALAMGFTKHASRPIRFPKLRSREKTFIDPELYMTWTYLTTADFFRF